jgi:hypothetical protein
MLNYNNKVVTKSKYKVCFPICTCSVDLVVVGLEPRNPLLAWPTKKARILCLDSL